MSNCGGGLEADENWMGTETSWVVDVGVVVARGQRDMVATSVQSFEGQGGKFKPYTPFNRKPIYVIVWSLCVSVRMCFF